MNRTQTLLHKSLIVFPAIALVVSVGCASASGSSRSSGRPGVSPAEQNEKKKVTTTTRAPHKKKKKTASSTTTLVKGTAGENSALALLVTISVQNEYQTGYSRSLFKHWIDADGDSCNTREEVLIAESLTRAQVDAFGCKVVAGDWLSPYDNVKHTNASELDIDHMVPLKEAWDSGAWSWTSAQRQSFANELSDARSLIAVTASVNRAKGDKDPSNWLPPVSSYRCEYLANWIAIKSHWKLSMDQSEYGRIKNVITSTCPNLTIAAWAGSSSGTASVNNSLGNATTATSDSATASPATTTASGSIESGLPTITPGAFCSPEGAHGVYKGTSYLCATTSATGKPYANGTKHWRQG